MPKYIIPKAVCQRSITRTKQIMPKKEHLSGYSIETQVKLWPMSTHGKCPANGQLVKLHLLNKMPVQIDE